MKKTLLILFPFSLLIALLLGAGCSATLDRALLTSQMVVQPASTNSTTGTVTPPATNTTYAPAPLAMAATQGIAALPFPGAGTAGLALGWLLTAYAAWKNKKSAVAVVTGVDAFRQVLNTTPEGQKLDAMFKDTLIEHQEAAGVLNAVSKLVNDYTGDTVKPAAQ